MSNVLRVRLTIAVAGGQQLVRATAMNHKKSMFFQAATDEQAINGLKAKLQVYEERRVVRKEYPKTVEVEL